MCDSKNLYNVLKLDCNSNDNDNSWLCGNIDNGVIYS